MGFELRRFVKIGTMALVIDDDGTETVTYRNETIRPAYLVVYGNDVDARLTCKAFVSSMFKMPLAS